MSNILITANNCNSIIINTKVITVTIKPIKPFSCYQQKNILKYFLDIMRLH